MGEDEWLINRVMKETVDEYQKQQSMMDYVYDWFTKGRPLKMSSYSPNSKSEGSSSTQFLLFLEKKRRKHKKKK